MSWPKEYTPNPREELYLWYAGKAHADSIIRLPQLLEFSQRIPHVALSLPVSFFSFVVEWFLNRSRSVCREFTSHCQFTVHLEKWGILKDYSSACLGWQMINHQIYHRSNGTFIHASHHANTLISSVHVSRLLYLPNCVLVACIGIWDHWIHFVVPKNSGFDSWTGKSVGGRVFLESG